MKFVSKTLAEISSVPALPARVAVSISTSEGELLREGTFPEGGSIESRGKTWYISTSTSLMRSRGVPAGISSVIFAVRLDHGFGQQ